jgi:hypothetical protein
VLSLPRRRGAWPGAVRGRRAVPALWANGAYLQRLYAASATPSAVPMHRLDAGDSYLECDARACRETSPAFEAKLGGELPEGWVISKRRQPGPGRQERRYFCPRHAHTERG